MTFLLDHDTPDDIAYSAGSGMGFGSGPKWQNSSNHRPSGSCTGIEAPKWDANMLVQRRKGDAGNWTARAG